MRSNRPIPGNPWPHDMVITVDDDPNNIEELLFIRSAWAIAQGADVPPLDPVPDPGDSFRPETATVDEWSARWERAWARAWQWYAIADRSQPPTPELLRQLSHPGQELHPSFPPFWSMEHGDEGIDRSAFNAWQQVLRGDMRLKLKQDPERGSLPALITAWQAGLETVVIVPYAGYFARRISPKHLVVSAMTRSDATLYPRALAGWVTGFG